MPLWQGRWHAAVRHVFKAAAEALQHMQSTGVLIAAPLHSHAHLKE